MADIAKMIEEIKGMTVLELNELVKAIETEFGVSAAAPVAVVGGPVGGGEVATVEEKTELNNRNNVIVGVSVITIVVLGLIVYLVFKKKARR